MLRSSVYTAKDYAPLLTLARFLRNPRGTVQCIQVTLSHENQWDPSMRFVMLSKAIVEFYGCCAWGGSFRDSRMMHDVFDTQDKILPK